MREHIEALVALVAKTTGHCTDFDGLVYLIWLFIIVIGGTDNTLANGSYCIWNLIDFLSVDRISDFNLNVIWVGLRGIACLNISWRTYLPLKAIVKLIFFTTCLN